MPYQKGNIHKALNPNLSGFDLSVYSFLQELISKKIEPISLTTDQLEDVKKTYLLQRPTPSGQFAKRLIDKIKVEDRVLIFGEFPDPNEMGNNPRWTSGKYIPPQGENYVDSNEVNSDESTNDYNEWAKLKSEILIIEKKLTDEKRKDSWHPDDAAYGI